MKLPARFAAIAVFSLVPCSSDAAVLTFEISELIGNSPLPSDYGSNITAATMGNYHYGTDWGFTPNVTVQYGSDSYWFNNGYSGLRNIVFSLENIVITLFAEPGFSVFLHGFDVGSYFSTSRTVSSVKVFNGENVELFAQDDVRISEEPVLFTFPNPLEGSILKIEIDTSNLGIPVQRALVGIDNVAFSQAVIPEPSIFTLMMASPLALAVIRRRK